MSDINKTKQIVNDYFNCEKIRVYLDTLNNEKTFKYHNIWS